MTRSFLIRFIVAGAGTAALYASAQIPGPHWYGLLLLPAYLVGTLVTGNAHAPSEIVAWIVVFAMLFGLVSAIGAIFARKS